MNVNTLKLIKKRLFKTFFSAFSDFFEPHFPGSYRNLQIAQKLTGYFLKNSSHHRISNGPSLRPILIIMSLITSGYDYVWK